MWMLEPVTIDRYGRTIAIVYKDKACLNEELIKGGYAWIYWEYCEQDICKDWYELETKAREKKLGLWQDRAPVPPWEFRKREREKK